MFPQVAPGVIPKFDHEVVFSFRTIAPTIKDPARVEL
jgi:hypothetical protein